MKVIKRVVALFLVLAMVVAIIPMYVLNVKGADNIVNLNELSPYKERTKREIASKYYNVKNNDYYNGTGDYYQTNPSLASPYAGGKLKDGVHQAMTDMTNFYRWLAGVDEYTRDSNHKDDLQAGAVIQNLYYNNTGELNYNLDTDWIKPDDMESSFWRLGSEAKHNIIALGYAPQEAIEGWLNEGYNGGNFDTIGHRNMLLSYLSTVMDFGYAGRVAYGLREKDGTTDLPCIAYPAPGAYPSNNIDPSLTAWSVELNSKKLKYKNLNDLTIRVTNLQTNESYDCTEANGKLIKQYTELVFKQPEVETQLYEAPYRVDIIGLTDSSGKEKTVEYKIDFFDLTANVPSTIDHISSDLLNVYQGQLTSNNVSLASIASILPDQVTIKTDNGRLDKLDVEWQYIAEQNKYIIKADSYKLPELINDKEKVLKDFAISVEQIPKTDNSRTFNYSVTEGESVQLKVNSYLTNADVFNWYKLLGDGTVQLVDQTAGRLTIEDSKLDDAGQYFAVYKNSSSLDVYVTPIKTLAVTPAIKLTNIELTPPTKTQYFVGQELDISGIGVKAVYSNGSKTTVNINKVQISGFDSRTAGQKAITVTYEGKSTTFTVDVIEKVVTGITVNPPTKTQYIEGQELDLTGGKIVVTFNDGSSKIVDLDNQDVVMNGYDKNKIGSQEVIVTYKNSKSGVFTVTVKPKEITGITVSELPTKTEYVEGQELDLTGGKITVTYNNGSSEVIDLTNSDVKVTGYNKNLVAKQSLTVNYGEKQTAFIVEVVAKAVSNITVTSPIKTQYIEGQELDLTGATINATYNDGSVVEEIVVSEEMVSGYNPKVLGDQTITVTYENKTATFVINVKAKLITLIEVSNNFKGL